VGRMIAAEPTDLFQKRKGRLEAEASLDLPLPRRLYDILFYLFIRNTPHTPLSKTIHAKMFQTSLFFSSIDTHFTERLCL